MSLEAFIPRLWDVPDLAKAGFSGAISSTWGSPMVKYGIIGATVAGIGIAAIAAGAETIDESTRFAGVCPTFSLAPKFTKHIQYTAHTTLSTMNYFSGFARYAGSAIMAANIYNYVYLDSPATPIIEAAIPHVQTARTQIFAGIVLTALTVSNIANARISEAINRIPGQDRNPLSVGKTTMKAVMLSIAQQVKSAAWWGAVSGVAIEGFKKGGRRFMFGDE
jgi:hypothetical protein